MTRPRIAAVLLALSAGLAGCEARLEPLSAPPPGAEATLDTHEAHLRITRGAAIAIECLDEGQVCEGLRAEADRRELVLARPAFQDDLAWNGRAGEAPRSAIVVAGLAEGAAVVSLTWEDGSTELTVEVVAP